MSKAQLPFAIDKNGNLVGVDQVARGLACNCTCPSCGDRLIAAQGAVKAWYFAHHGDTDCAAGYESAMHLAVKEIVESEKALLLPGCNVLCHPEGERCPTIPSQIFHVGAFRKARLVGRYEYLDWPVSRSIEGSPCSGGATSQSKLVTFDQVILEQTEGDIRPDIIGIVGGRRLYIEVAVTHFVDKGKEIKIRARGVSTVEIAVTQVVGERWTMDKLRDVVLKQTENKIWIYNPRLEELAEAVQQENERRQDEIDLQERALRAAEAKTRQARYEEAARIKKAKKDVFERKYKPSMELWFRHSRYFQSLIILSLCPSHVSLKIRHGFDQELSKLLAVVARKFSGSYNNNQYQWEFADKAPSTIGQVTIINRRPILYSIAKAIAEVSPDFDIHRIEVASDELAIEIAKGLQEYWQRPSSLVFVVN